MVAVQEDLRGLLPEDSGERIQVVSDTILTFKDQFARLEERMFPDHQLHGERALSQETQWYVTPTSLERKYLREDGQRVKEDITFYPKAIIVTIQSEGEGGVTHSATTTTMGITLEDSSDGMSIADFSYAPKVTYQWSGGLERGSGVINGHRFMGDGFLKQNQEDPGFSDEDVSLETFIQSAQELSTFIAQFI